MTATIRGIVIVASISSLIVVCASTAGLRSSDLPFLALIVAPYLLLGLLAGRVRKQRADSGLLLIGTVLLSMGGTLLLVLNGFHHRPVPEPGLVQSVTIIVVPLLQLLAVTVLGLILQLRRMLT
jgi:FtsH-binding integral membrane protein